MNQSPSQTTHLFTNRQITAMLLPLMAEQLLITLMGMVNTFMVAHVGSYAISAVSLVDSINILVIQAFYALSAPSIWGKKRQGMPSALLNRPCLL